MNPVNGLLRRSNYARETVYKDRNNLLINLLSKRLAEKRKNFYKDYISIIDIFAVRIKVLASRIIYTFIISLTADRLNITSKSYISTTKIINYSELSLYRKIPSILINYLLSL